jgi:hypothetical protein
LAALQQLSREDARFEPTLESLIGRVTRHTAPLMPASQRLFLWRESPLQRRCIFLATVPAKRFGSCPHPVAV